MEPLNAYQTDVTAPIGTPTTFKTSFVPLAPTGVIVSFAATSDENVKVTWDKPTVDSSNAISLFSVKFKNNAGTFVPLSGICSVLPSSCGATTCECSVPMSTLTSSLAWTISAT